MEAAGSTNSSEQPESLRRMDHERGTATGVARGGGMRWVGDGSSTPGSTVYLPWDRWQLRPWGLDSLSLSLFLVFETR